jgi:hypothetical protein
MINVTSSSIAAVGFEDGTLAVRFHTSSTIYLHHGVSYEVYEALMNAYSKGSYYNEHIRDRYH